MIDLKLLNDTIKLEVVRKTTYTNGYPETCEVFIKNGSELILVGAYAAQHTGDQFDRWAKPVEDLAALLAAAPELLMALEALVNSADIVNDYKARNLARAAIARAKGE